ncbi:MAG: MlaA family lipoprotein, partial [Caulobacteraceae bacterium]
MRQRLLLALFGLGLALAAAQAHAATPGDPFEPVNRKIFTSSMAAERKYFEPLAKLYHKLTPGALGDAIHNALTNLGEPVVVINDLLQVRLGHALHDGERLIIDSTYG